MSRIILNETGSLGVRWLKVERDKLPRRVETIKSPWGPIRIKVALIPSGERAIPEYDDCRAVASKHHVPLLEVIDRAARLYYDEHPGTNRKRG